MKSNEKQTCAILQNYTLLYGTLFRKYRSESRRFIKLTRESNQNRQNVGIKSNRAGINQEIRRELSSGVKENITEQAEVRNGERLDVEKYSLSGNTNIVQAEFEKKVDEIEKNTYNSDNAVIMGVTPKVLQKIGLSPLPIAMTKNHIYSVAVSEARARKEGRYNKKAHYHDLGFNTVKDIYNKISEPLMVIAHPDFAVNKNKSKDSTHKVVVLVDLSVNGKQVIAPITVDYQGMYNNTLIDVNLVATYFDKGNISDYIKEAIALETMASFI